MIANVRENCPVARALSVVGERWSLLIIRDLLLDGPRRFQDFADSMPSISPSTLSKRLKTLENHGIIERRIIEERPPRSEYQLTEVGLKLRPAVAALRDWGSLL